jgi:hypothetical protein
MSYFVNARRRGSSTNGGSFSDVTIQAVWEKGKIVSGYNSNLWRKDACNAWMKRDEYGNTSSSYGWEIDHIKPAAQNGSDSLYNLQPLQWENNRHKSDNYPHWTCIINA